MRYTLAVCYVKYLVILNTTVPRLFSSMLFVRLVHWKQPLRCSCLRSYVSRFFLFLRYTVKRLFSFFFTRFLFATFCHGIIHSHARIRRMKESLLGSLSLFFSLFYQRIGSGHVFGTYGFFSWSFCSCTNTCFASRI